MLIPLIFVCLPYLTTVECRFKGKIHVKHTPNMWLTNIPDSRKLNTLAFVGTRDPPTFETTFKRLPKLLPLSDKLTVGIRVFDMGVRRINNDFAMYNGSFSMRAKFVDLVQTIKKFLKDNPKEFVIMIMHAESTASKSTLSECEILRKKYVEKYPNLFVENWSLDDTVGQHRGKILLLEKSPEFNGCSTSLSCVVHDQQNENLKNDLGEYYEYVRELQAEVNKQNSKCYLFYMTTNREFYFKDEKISADAKLTKMIQYNDQDIPETFGSLIDTFNNTKNSFYTIVADLPTLDVLNLIISSNTK
ncbi:unnamed protein product [Colias eurytheme]|nr:unnamed protein product [Colias eurytheme]